MEQMATKQAVNLRELILEALNTRSFRPAELIEELQSRDVTESRLKDQLAALIDSREVELSPDRRIRLVSPRTKVAS